METTFAITGTGRRTATTRSHSVALGSALAMLAAGATAQPNALSPQPLPPGSNPITRPVQGTATTTSARPIVDILNSSNARVNARATRNPRTDPSQIRSEYPLSAGGQQLMMAVRNPGAGQAGQGPRVTGQSMSSATSARPGLNALRTCAEARLAPEITRITALSPGRSFTIDGICFGERIGRMQLAGGPGNGTTLTFSKWTDTQIVGQVGKVSGARDGNVELALFTGDGQRAVPRMARFIAERATVRVPPERWAPGGSLSWAVTDYPQIARLSAQFPGVTWQPNFQLPQRFSAKLTDGCEVVAVGVDGAGFDVLRPMQFEASPSASDTIVSVSLRTAATARIREDLHSPIGATGTPMSYTVSRGSLTLTADAVCPVGVAP